MKIALVKPGMGEIITGYDIADGSMEPLQLAIIAGLIKVPDEVSMYDDRLETIPFDDNISLAAITVDSFSARRAYEIAAEYRKRNVKVILGGLHVSLLPEEGVEYADAVVIGDVEPVWDQIMKDLKTGILQKTYQAPFGNPQEGCFPDRSVFRGKKYLPVSLIQFSRGCGNNCSFCSVTKFFHNSHACRKMEDVLYEIEKDNLKTILFVDDNLVFNTKELKAFLSELIPLKVRWASQSGINMVNDKQLLKLMKDSGCMGNLVGFESINVNTLEWFNKSANLRNFSSYSEEMDILRDFGFLTWGSFMIGNDFDTIETIDETVEFAIKNKFAFAFFHILMPYPGTEIYRQFKEEGRLLFDGHWWNHPDYRYNQATFKPRLISPEKLSEATVKANLDFYSFSSIARRLFDSRTNMRNFYNLFVYARLNYILRVTTMI
jgi:radical SAM superfamily enzyme YgiQ (UPF0313 family)